MENQKLLDTINKPGLHQVFVRHDDWCLLLLGYGDCNCKPTIEVVTVTDNNAEQVAQKVSDSYSSLDKFRRSQKN